MVCSFSIFDVLPLEWSYMIEVSLALLASQIFVHLFKDR
jgi:hypothetical protein